MSTTAATLTPEEQHFVDGCKYAQQLAFITHLENAGKATREPIKAAGEGQPKFRVVHEDFTEGEITDLFHKYAKEWVPHREELVAGYLNIILGGEAAA